MTGLEVIIMDTDISHYIGTFRDSHLYLWGLRGIAPLNDYQSSFKDLFVSSKDLQGDVQETSQNYRKAPILSF